VWLPSVTAQHSYIGQGLCNNRNFGVFSLGGISLTGVIPAAQARVVALLPDGANYALAGADAAARAETFTDIFRNTANQQTIGNAAFRGIGRLVGAGANAAADANAPVTITITQPTLAGGWRGDIANLGLYKRQQSQSFDPTVNNYRGFLTDTGGEGCRQELLCRRWRKRPRLENSGQDPPQRHVRLLRQITTN
jgi:hypothetical protein